MASNERSGETPAQIASRVLRDPKATPDMKTLAGSVLTQAPDKPKVKPKAKTPKK